MQTVITHSIETKGNVMSLNFDFSKTAYLNEVGSIWQRKQDGTDSGYLLVELESIVWNAATVGIGSITEASVERFINRVELWESVYGPTVGVYVEPDGPSNERRSAFDPEVARKCIGFSCNVSPQSKTVFLNRLADHAPL
jgi:hypothetical protein